MALPTPLTPSDVQRHAEGAQRLMAQLERVYAFIGMPLDATARAAIEAMRKSSPQHRYGKHVYHLESFGLEAEALNARFADYRERFKIPREDKR